MDRRMKGIIVVALVALGGVALLSVARGQMGMMHRGGMMGMSNVRHQYYMHAGLPSAYASNTNPLKPTAENLAAGRKLYEERCALCHGAKGFGDGPAGAALNPPPANIAALMQRPMATDGYLYWSIAEGGAPLGSPMPAFKDALKPDQIWQIILYIRTL
jgi:mono/diheme cytochrome c family protein